MSEGSEGSDRTRLRGQIIRSGVHGEYVITREAVEGMLEQLQGSPKPVNLEHDPTVPPVGRVVNDSLVELPDGEVALETEMELFEGTVPAVLVPVQQLKQTMTDLEPIRADRAVLQIITDPRSYQQGDIDGLRRLAAEAGEATTFDGAMRFSVLPDALLVIALGLPASAVAWFLKGFFTKLGEASGEAVGKEIGLDLATAYRRFRHRLVDTVERRRDPKDRPPITMFTLELERPGGGIVEVEGSSRAVGDALAAFLDAGSELLPVAQVFLRHAPQPERLAKMHFVHAGDTWVYRYGLDDDAEPVMIVALSDETFAQALAETERTQLSLQQPVTDGEAPGAEGSIREC